MITLTFRKGCNKKDALLIDHVHQGWSTDIQWSTLERLQKSPNYQKLQDFHKKIWHQTWDFFILALRCDCRCCILLLSALWDFSPRDLFMIIFIKACQVCQKTPNTTNKNTKYATIWCTKNDKYQICIALALLVNIIFYKRYEATKHWKFLFHPTC